jgi:signal transduction histidine kinase
MTERQGDGLRNLEERSAAFGGKTSIDSVAKGTTVRIELSLYVSQARRLRCRRTTRIPWSRSSALQASERPR